MVQILLQVLMLLLTDPDNVILKRTDNTYAESGVLETTATLCALAGSGRVAVTSEYVAGVTAISLIETSTSNNMTDWSMWQVVSTNGELQSPNREFIRFRITLNTADTYADYLNAVIYDKFVTGDSDFTGIILSNIF